jgi:hypothetical protein
VDGNKAARTEEGAKKELNRGHGIDLPSHVQLYPMPTVHGNHNKAGASPNSGDGLTTTAGGSLNPAWVEWLMGFPPGWTDIGTQNPTSQEPPKESPTESTDSELSATP